MELLLPVTPGVLRLGTRFVAEGEQEPCRKVVELTLGWGDLPQELLQTGEPDWSAGLFENTCLCQPADDCHTTCC